MKVFIVIVAVAFIACASAITEEQKKKANEHVAACIKESGASQADATKLQMGDFSNKDEKVQCFSKCFLEKAGFMDHSGNFVPSVAIEKLSTTGDKEKITKNVEACKDKVGKNACEKAYNIYECYYLASH